MQARGYWLVSLVAGCGLVQVNGKPVGSTSSTSSSAQQQPQQQPQETSPGAMSSATPASASVQPAAAEPAGAQPAGGKDLDDISAPDKTSKRASWTPILQYKALVEASSYQPYAAFVIADALGDKLSHAGRLAVIQACLGNRAKDVSSAAFWATCGDDVSAFDMNAFGRELQKEGLSADARKELVEKAKQAIDEAKAVGAAVAQAAKDDPGVAQVVAMGGKAREEWKAFASANAEELAELAKLEDLVSQDKNGLAGDCVGKTQPAMEKILKATKWREQDLPIDPNYFYVNLLPKTTEAFVAAEAWGACAALVHPTGAVVYSAAVGTDYGYSQGRFRRYHRRGPRTLTIAKLFDDDSFKPKFTSRSIGMRKGIEEPPGDYKADRDTMQTPHQAIISKLVKNGDETTIKFARDKVSVCAEWRDTKKIQTVTPNGDVMYEKQCMRREMVDNEYDDIVTAAAFTNGLAPGVQLTEEFHFPIVGMKGQKVVAALGIKL